MRAIDVLKNSHIIFCENTKHSLKLLRNFQIIGPKLEKFTDHDFDKKSQIIANDIKNGKVMSLISDAGSPLISDPGKKLVNFLLSNNCLVETIPGASSMTSAIQLSGFLNPFPFLFLGFFPKKIIQKKNILKNFNNVNLVFFSTSSQLNKDIQIIFELSPLSKIVILNEMTKKFEKRIFLNFEKYKENQNIILKGELTVCADFYGMNLKKEVNNKQLLKDLKKYGKKNIYEIYRTQYKISRNDLYKKILDVS